MLCVCIITYSAVCYHPLLSGSFTFHTSNQVMYNMSTVKLGAFVVHGVSMVVVLL